MKTHDGAKNMTGIRSGVKTQILRENEKATPLYEPAFFDFLKIFSLEYIVFTKWYILRSDRHGRGFSLVSTWFKYVPLPMYLPLVA